ncbi:MAG: DNA polymerase III subunit beta [Candidatus Portnoybacteria bacterium RBG_19FT_COMBO_36_7]|uniref:Beta sliding clamp n=1 Tax=Candidatus Portnoybacteria bacterium RBG_19FT_COMBO_36_7 TaxID=1801992 RepID=A0A1G2F7I6_9BACT|nr:MAG: DNA polymerase III subunit beta [Candidatus Portnoybacteria bacterium RBG_19FT_COMBO_36_7]
MKITCLQENLKTNLNIAQNIVGKNLTLPILNNLLLEIDNGQLKISSTNLEIGINTWTSGKIEKTGSITCPAKILTSFINNLPNKKIELEAKDNNLYIKCENYKAAIKGLSAEDFPLIPKIKEKPISVFKKSEALKNDLNKVVGAAALSESRPEFSGVLFKFEKDSVRFVATDSFRLAEKIIYQTSSISQPNSLIVPQRTIQELIRILGEKQSQEVRFVLGDSQILFDLDEVQLISRLIDGQYPDYQQIIPKNFETKVTLSKDELINNIRIASIFSSKINDVKILIRSEKIEILSQDPDLGENKSQMSARVQGKPMEIIFNFRYLMEGLANIGTKQVLLGLNPEIQGTSSRSNPAVIKPVGEDGYLYVVMPIKT